MSHGGTIGQARQARPAGYRQEIVGFRGCVFGMVAKNFRFSEQYEPDVFWKQHGKKILAWLPRDVGFDYPGKPVAAQPRLRLADPHSGRGGSPRPRAPLARSSASIWTTEIETMCCDLDGQGKAAVIRVGMQFHRFRAS